MPLTVGLMYNLKQEGPLEEGEPPDGQAELDNETTILAVAEALRWGGHEVMMIEGDEKAWDRLRETRIDIAFNMCEGIRGRCRESQIPALLEMLGIPYTGSNPLTLALALEKPLAKKLFLYHGIPTPRFCSVAVGERPDDQGLHYPLFVKPAREGSSMGISPTSVVRNVRDLATQVDRVHTLYRQEALVEEFIDGREFTVGIVGNHPPVTLPVMEINFDPCPPHHGRVYSYQFKQEWDADQFYVCPAPVTPEQEALLVKTAIRAFEVLGCQDVGRVDIRLDRQGEPHVLEVNPLPGLTPAFSDLPRVADVAKLGYNRLVNLILEAALERHGMLGYKRLLMGQSA